MPDWVLSFASEFWQWLRDAWDWGLGLASGFWSWLHDTSPGQATFIGSVFGFLALLLGALFNAHLNRRRDDRLRREEQRTLAAALQAELVRWRDRLRTAIPLMASQAEVPGGWEIPTLTPRLFPEIISKLGLLPSAAIGSVIAAYDQANWYSLRLSHYAARSDTEVMLPETYIALAEETIDVITHAVAQLDHFLADRGGRWRWMRATG